MIKQYASHLLVFVISTYFMVVHMPYLQYTLPIMIWLSIITKFLTVYYSKDNFKDFISKLKENIGDGDLRLHKLCMNVSAICYGVVLFNFSMYITLILFFITNYLLNLRIESNWKEYAK